jgi:hypothetical protein
MTYHCQGCGKAISQERAQRAIESGYEPMWDSAECGALVRKRNQRRRERLAREASRRVRIKHSGGNAIEDAPLMVIRDDDDGNDVAQILRDDSRAHNHGKRLARDGLRGRWTTIY